MSISPENTLASQRLAYELGADFVEVDVRLTRDGIPVIMHDWDVDRTTDGQGGVGGMTLQQLKLLDAGSWFGSAFTGERIPSLAEVFQVAKEYNGRVLLDIKVERMGSTLLPVIRSSGLAPDQIMVATWTDTMTAEYAALLPGYRIMRHVTDPVTGATMASRNIMEPALLRLREMGVTDLFLANGPVSQVETRRFHAAGLRASVIYYEPNTAAYYADEGVDAFWTDFSEVSLQRVRNVSCEWANWAEQHGLAPDARTGSADPDGDGAGNLEEYTRGLLPLKADFEPAHDVKIVQSAASGNSFMWRVNLRENWSQYLEISPQVNNGGAWNYLPAGFLTQTASGGAEFRLPVSGPRLFYRMQIAFKK